MPTALSRDGSAEASTSAAAISSVRPHPTRRSPLPPYLRAEPAAHRPTPSPTYDERYPIASAAEGRRAIRIPASLHSMVAGAGAGLVSSIATCPLDVVKTTLQAQSAPRGKDGYEGVSKTCLRIYRQSGLRGFYRGLGPTIAGYLPTWGIYFTVYDFTKDKLRGVPLAIAHPDISHVFAAMTAGATGTILTNPLWVVKTRFMAQAILPPSATRYRTTLEAVHQIYTKEGFRAFYKGLVPSLFGVSHVAVQFGLYEKTKTLVGEAHEGQPLTPQAILACSAFSKMVASLATYPHEVLRTRIQVQRSRPIVPEPPAAKPPPPRPHASGLGPRSPAAPEGPFSLRELYSPLVTGSNPPVPEDDAVRARAEAEAELKRQRRRRRWTRKGGIIDVFNNILRQDGWRGFYRGLSINLVRTVPSSAVTMLTYELIMRNLAAQPPSLAGGGGGES